MTRYGKLDSLVLQFLVLLMASCSVYAVKELVGYEWSGRVGYVIFPMALLWGLIRGFKTHLVSKVYIVALCIAYFLHVVSGVGIEEPIHTTLFVRCAPMYLLSVYLCMEKPYKNVTLVAVAFFVVECLMSLFERVSMTHFIRYANEMKLMATSVDMSFNNYRSYALMFHPLYNANVVSVAMGFILCSNRIKGFFKIILLALGLVGLWGFNSRGAILAWGGILLYRLVFCNRKWWLQGVILVVICAVFPSFWDLAASFDTEIMIRAFSSSDESTQSRVLALSAFLAESWNARDIIVGGRIIHYWSSQIALENGVLLDIGFWGWIAGPIKVVSEILLTWYACRNFPNSSKIVIMFALWGVAFMNNNSFHTWLMPMFVFFLIGFAPVQAKEDERFLGVDVKGVSEDS